MVSRAAAKREADFLGTDVPDVAQPPSPSSQETPMKRKRGRPPKNRALDAQPSPAATPRSAPRTAPPTPSSTLASRPTPGTVPRPAVNGNGPSTPALPARTGQTPQRDGREMSGEQMSRQTSGTSEGTRQAAEREAAAQAEILAKLAAEEEGLEAPDVRPDEARAMLRVMETFEAPDVLDVEAGSENRTLRQLLSASEPVPVSVIESHIHSVPREKGPSQFHTLALSLLHSLRQAPPAASTSTPPRADSPSHKRRKTSEAPAASTSSARPAYVLHRYLEPPNGGPLGLSGSLGQGTDVFTRPTYNLDDEALQAAASLKDTDLVALQPERDDFKSLSKSIIDPELLKDLAIPPVTTRKEERILRRRKAKLDDAVGAGALVTPLYYSAYSSFAPSYNSELATLTQDATSAILLSHQRLEKWRPTQAPATSPDRNVDTALNPVTLERLGIPLSSALAEASPSDAKALVDAELRQNASLLRRLQNRQHDRLWTSVGVGHGPTQFARGVRVPPSMATPVDVEEQAEADSLKTSLARLAQLTSSSSAAPILPSAGELRRAQHGLVQTRTPIVRGSLQLISSRAVREDVLTGEPDMTPLVPAPSQPHQGPQHQQPQQMRVGTGTPQQYAPARPPMPVSQAQYATGNHNAIRYQQQQQQLMARQ